MLNDILKKYFNGEEIIPNFNIKASMKKIEVNEEKCIACNRCVEVCPVNAIEPNTPFPVEIDEKKCIYCGKCVEVCPVNAINIFKASAKIEDGELKIEKNIKKYKELIYNRKKCCLCLVCLKTCPFGAIFEDKSTLKFDMKKCTLCGHCGEVCPLDAIEFS
ncbi:4Fe-4S binding protein [Methanotorris igneus]|uniref:4Fe-4S ferredoxin iron-sulfur binding domain-containing protein n=1 Tax=Methanotorris igneus (strain DSM 5666 / JCM 11834 / Kol 5) TaxID=880724 RepID=F6BBF2_METIK|nr:4Fe-4S binding protein [Methanotorris igneus]AEF97159.1 4Fe-4S ferredoxin iron-sulfur binding domain-containing protein [Methanotorris igneus Kol 5]